MECLLWYNKSKLIMGDIYFMNKELILTLLNIPKVSRKTINYILSEEYDLELNIEQIVKVFECCR